MRPSFLVESLILYLAFFKTILAALVRALGLPLSFLPSKPSFLLDHSTTQNSDFSTFSAISTTDKPVNQSIQAYALTQLNVFALRGYSRTRTLWRGSTQIEYSSQNDGTTSMKIANYIERHNFC